MATGMLTRIDAQTCAEWFFDARTAGHFLEQQHVGTSDRIAVGAGQVLAERLSRVRWFAHRRE